MSAAVARKAVEALRIALWRDSGYSTVPSSFPLPAERKARMATEAIALAEALRVIAAKSTPAVQFELNAWADIVELAS